MQNVVFKVILVSQAQPIWTATPFAAFAMARSGFTAKVAPLRSAVAFVTAQQLAAGLSNAIACHLQTVTTVSRTACWHDNPPGIRAGMATCYTIWFTPSLLHHA